MHKMVFALVLGACVAVPWTAGAKELPQKPAAYIPPFTSVPECKDFVMRKNSLTEADLTSLGIAQRLIVGNSGESLVVGEEGGKLDTVCQAAVSNLIRSQAGMVNSANAQQFIAASAAAGYKARVNEIESSLLYRLHLVPWITLGTVFFLIAVSIIGGLIRRSRYSERRFDDSMEDRSKKSPFGNFAPTISGREDLPFELSNLPPTEVKPENQGEPSEKVVRPEFRKKKK